MVRFIEIAKRALPTFEISELAERRLVVRRLLRVVEGFSDRFECVRCILRKNNLINIWIRVHKAQNSAIKQGKMMSNSAKQSISPESRAFDERRGVKSGRMMAVRIREDEARQCGRQLAQLTLRRNARARIIDVRAAPSASRRLRVVACFRSAASPERHSAARKKPTPPMLNKK